MMQKDQKNYLDLLTVVSPDPGWHVQEAYLATYSLDLRALGMMLMAMAGTWRQEGNDPKRMDAVKAIDSMRGKVHVVVNPTRIKALGKSPPEILHLLDQFYHEYKSNLKTPHSWHPKIILVKFETDKRPTKTGKKQKKQPAMWRLWFGSKNFTLTKNLDLGIVFEGQKGPNRTNIPGVATAAQHIAKEAKRPSAEQDRLRTELDLVKWKLPVGITGKCAIELFLPTDKQRGYPEIPKGAKELILVSPFLDVETLKHFGKTSNTDSTKRILISTRPELERFEAKECLGRFDETYSHHDAVLTGVTTDVGEIDKAEDDRLTADEREEVDEEYAIGLHAKFLLVRTRHFHSLWLGSANATQRGWMRNVEVMGEFSISKTLYQRLWHGIRDNANPIEDHEELEFDGEDNTQATPTEKIENARREMETRIRIRSLVLEEKDNELMLLVPFRISEFAEHSDLVVKCGLATCDSRDLIEWKNHDNNTLSLGPHSDIKTHKRTANVTIQLACKDKTTSFITKAKYKSLNYLDRDRAAYEEYLNPETFLEMVFWELSGTRQGLGGGEWDGTRVSGADPSESRGLTFTVERLPTVDMILKAWSVDETVLDRVKYQIEFAGKIFESKRNENSATALNDKDKERLQRSDEARAKLQKFVQTFHKLEKGLRARTR